MARAHRIGLVTVLVAAVYLLATFNVVPLLGEEVRRQILPLVRDHCFCFTRVLFSRFCGPNVYMCLIDSMVGPRRFWVVFSMVHRLGSLNTQGVPRCIWRTNWSKSFSPTVFLSRIRFLTTGNLGGKKRPESERSDGRLKRVCNDVPEVLCSLEITAVYQVFGHFQFTWTTLD